MTLLFVVVVVVVVLTLRVLSSRRDRSRGGGDLTSPAIVYVPDFKNKGKRQNKTYQFKIKPLSKNQKP